MHLHTPDRKNLVAQHQMGLRWVQEEYMPVVAQVSFFLDTSVYKGHVPVEDRQQ